MAYGNQNGGGEVRLQFREALRRVLARQSRQNVVKGLESIARQLVKSAKAGEGWAIREIADRIDGKPQQAIDVQGTFRHIDVSANPLSMEAWRERYVIEGEAEDVTLTQAGKSVTLNSES